MSYEAWRVSYQSSEQAARAAWEECERLRAERISVASELQSARLKLRGFRNRLISAFAETGSGTYEFRRAVAEDAVNVFEDSLDRAMEGGSPPNARIEPGRSE